MLINVVVMVGFNWYVDDYGYCMVLRCIVFKYILVIWWFKIDLVSL